MLNQKQFKLVLFVFASFLFFSWTTPIHLHPYRTFYQDAAAILGVLFTLGFMMVVPKALLRIPKTVIVPLALIAIIGVQTWNGFILFPADMVFPVVYLLSFALALICGATLAMQQDGVRLLCNTFAYTVIAIGLLSVFLQHIQVINLNWTPFLDPLSWNDSVRPYANVAQPNLLALLLCFSIASVWFVYLHRQIKPVSAIIMVLLLLWGLALTQSRVAWMILPMFLVLCWQQPQDKAAVAKPTLVLLLCIYIGFIFLVPTVFHLLGIETLSIRDHASQTGSRLIFWQQALAMSIAHPWLGVGWYQFGPQQVLTSSAFAPTEYSELAHNIVLNFAAEIGWPMTILLFSGAIWWFYRCCICRWKQLEVRFLSLLILATMAHSMVEFPLWHGFVLMPFGVIVGALQIEEMGWESIALARGWLAGLMAATVVLVSGISWDYSRVVDGFAALKWTQEGKKSGIGSIEKPEFTLYPQFYDYFHIIQISTDPGISEKDLSFLENASLRFGFTPVLSRLALACANNGKQGEALHALIAIQRLNGTDYLKTYSDWRGFAEKFPAVYGEIFRHMPKAPLPSKQDPDPSESD